MKKIANPYPYSCIEINIPEQILKCYIGSDLVLESPCITGTKGVSDTPTGTFHIFEKIRDKLILPEKNGDKALAEYFMAYDTTGKGFAIHDAEWARYSDDEFNPKIYLTDGSDGCIRLPLEAIRKLFDISFLGMPVIIKDNDFIHEDGYALWRHSDFFDDDEDKDCFALSIASMLRRFDKINEMNPGKFSPHTVYKAGAVSSSPEKAAQMFNISFLGKSEMSVETLLTCQENGEMCLIYVSDGKESHYVVCDYASKNKNIIFIFDGKNGYTRLAKYSYVKHILRFK